MASALIFYFYFFISFLSLSPPPPPSTHTQLKRWRSVIDGIVVGIDDRTSDGTHLAVVESLPDIPRWLFYHHFEGFGLARTKVFKVGCVLSCCGLATETNASVNIRCDIGGMEEVSKYDSHPCC
jgi:hypothetical protein